MKTFTFFLLETWYCLLLIWRSCGKSSPAKNNVTHPKLRLKISIATHIKLWRNLCPPFDTCEYCQRQRQSVERWLINLWQGNDLSFLTPHQYWPDFKRLWWEMGRILRMKSCHKLFLKEKTYQRSELLWPSPKWGFIPAFCPSRPIEPIFCAYKAKRLPALLPPFFHP